MAVLVQEEMVMVIIDRQVLEQQDKEMMVEMALMVHTQVAVAEVKELSVEQEHMLQ
jgi:hypothetical protein